MFESQDKPRVFALPCGVDFPRALVDGLIARSAGQPPEALARAEVIVNTARMQRRVRSLFDAGPTLLLPRLMLLTDLAQRAARSGLPPALPALRRRLELSQLIAKLLDAQPDLASRASLYDLSDSLATLFDEMQSEGVSTDSIRNLDVSDLSDHWSRAQQFIAIADEFVDRTDDAMDKEARQRQVVQTLIEQWQIAPPQHPVILAGSTGSRGTTLMLMEAIARLPQGAVVLPGFDFDQPDRVWAGLDDPLISEDHPQYRFYKLMKDLELSPRDVQPWTMDSPPFPARNRMVSLALRPAPVTDAWMSEGPSLTDLDHATDTVTLVEAPNPRAEALTIALRLRQAAEDGQSAALITPDRMLTRQVSAALDRWDILPDDSAGQPLQLSPPGRFLRHVAELFCHELTPDRLLTLLKHPLTHDGPEAARGEHLRHSRDYELHLRRNGPPFPDADSFAAYAAAHELMPGWADWLSEHFAAQTVFGTLPLSDWITRLRARAEGIATGSQADGSGTLWDKKAGQKALEVIADLEDNARYGGEMTARDFADLLGALLAQGEVRDRDAPYGSIMIWGTLEARVQGADLVILAGLNEGSWPEAASPDPWLNRQMRHKAGLLLPERRIGLSAHDFQQAVAAPEVWLTRAVRSEEADTVPSRWLNRMQNLLRGLPDQGGRAALDAIRARGQIWLDWASALEVPLLSDPAQRPAPRPPVAARPRQLSITEIPKLIRDPYAIYAKHVLRLKPLDPLMREPDALLRGIVVHKVFEDFIRDSRDNPDLLTPETLIERTRAQLQAEVPWPVARSLWLARIARIAESFVAGEQTRRAAALPSGFEKKGTVRLDPLDFHITGQADRIDVDARGCLHLFDYKTGDPPTDKQQRSFDKQLLIEAAMAEQGAFADYGAARVERAVFIGLKSPIKEVPAPLADEPPAKVWSELKTLIEAYFDPAQGYSSRRMVHRDDFAGDYDHLARYGEWDRSDMPKPEDLT
ncbi:double-strand break repair protein AddB [Phaeobacter sp. QD34_3]|uniref:double-strand break repair protein AddB n=1 Tax=unclassified Phaeobacter TaxID=2621772 RepID=UPI00237EF7AB|nr:MULTISPECIES: double-strand break repair protein AddB [unclassified Phaeobacter]MDE4134756.1 double-strand break repair protein AddB [Phaeobacter sp. QD34_3]MDE4138380.1 double-strand break repair protein AddB [Phaeobacter sp. QD34_24]